jgi:hypothetical protein
MRFAMFVTRKWIALLAVAMIGASAGRAEATEKLRKELAVIATSLSKALKGMEETSVAMGAFKGPSTLPTSSGPLFTKLLKEELEKQSIGVNSGSKYMVKGEYLDVIDARSNKLAVQIKGELTDKSNTPVLTFNRGAIESDTTLASLFGITTELASNATPEKRDETLQNGLDNPKVFISEARVAASSSSPYAVEMLVAGRPRPSVEDEGLAFCKIARDEIYGLRIHNNSPFDAAVTITIDGLSVFAFSENKNYTHYIIPPKSKADILGWHRSNQVSDSFRVVAYADSEVARALPSSASVGTITAVFAAAWDANSSPPPDEAPRSKGAPPADATGRGPAVAAKFVEVVKDGGVVRSSVSIRYTKPDPTDLPQ